jgi:hypothetical protein
MKRVLLVAVLVLCGMATPALAWDPDSLDAGTPDPASPSAPDPAPLIAPPPGIYYVTDTYVADVVTTEGSLTTYLTTTIHESTGSYARVLDVVATGQESSFDGTSFNGRVTLSDGRAVAGTYYENYVLTSSGFVPVSIVFFQDDSELARLAQRVPAGAATPVSSAQSGRAPSPVAAPGGASSGTTPLGSGERGAWPADLPPSSNQLAVPESRLPPVAPAISLKPAGPALARIEVLRGRPIALWLRAFVGGREIPVREWSLRSGEPGRALALRGPGTVPFETSWDRLPPPDGSFELDFALTVQAAGHEVVIAAPLSVVVRSPALES